MLLYSGNHTILIFFNSLLIVHIGLLVGALSSPINSIGNLRRKSFFGVLLFLFFLLLVGLRPVSGQYFGDMARYGRQFWDMVAGRQTGNYDDVGFITFLKFSTFFTNDRIFFLLAFLLYTYPLYLASKLEFKKYWYYSFLILISSFSFFSYGTNGIRNGLATSMMILALTQSEKTIRFVILALIALSFHKSVVLVIVAYAVTKVFNNNKLILIGWIASIPLSYAMSGFWESFIAERLITDDKVANYLLNKGMDYVQTNVGFRWDFIAYSASGVLAGWYFIFRKKFEDALYIRLFNIYLICNAVWILIIQVPFSNRFAYLSWFMLGLIIVHPFLKQNFWKSQHQRLAIVMCLYFSFTYLMNVILA